MVNNTPNICFACNLLLPLHIYNVGSGTLVEQAFKNCVRNYEQNAYITSICFHLF